MVKAIPEGYPQVTPYLCVDGAAAAMDFYCGVLGAKERMRMPAPDGKIGHTGSPKALGATPVLLHVYVEDVDAVFEQALAATAGTSPATSRTSPRRR